MVCGARGRADAPPRNASNGAGFGESTTTLVNIGDNAPLRGDANARMRDTNVRDVADTMNRA